ncbi:MAG: STN domain-containing protein [Anaeromyxobacteraceae bacterium]
MVIAALLALLAAAPPAVPRAPRPPAPPAATSDAKRLGDWPAKPSGKTVTLDDHLSVDAALARVAAAAGWNLVANTGRLGEHKLVVAVRNAPVEEALDAILEGSPLVARRRGNTVTIAPGSAAPPAEVPVLSGFDAPSGKRFSGDLADVPIADALRKVASSAGLSIMLPPGLRGAVNGQFRDAPVEDVLRALLSQAGLVATRRGAVITVSRESGPSLVIRGGKRGLSFEGDLGREIDETVRDAMRDARDAQRDAKRDAREAKREAKRDGGAAAAAPEEDADEGEDAPGPKPRRHGGDRVLRGDQVIGPGERAREVVVLLGSVRLEAGATADQITAVMGSIELGPGVSVEREVVAIGGDIHVSPGARVGADAVSIGGRIIIDEGGEVEGQQTSIDVPGLGGLLTLVGTKSLGPTRHHSTLWRLGTLLLQFAVFFGLGLLVLVVFPRRIETLTGSLVHAPVKAVLTGVLGTLAVPVAIILLVATVVGIPFIAVVVLALAVATVLGYTALALHFGRALPFRFERGGAIVQLAIGTAILVAIGHIPLIGWLAWIAAWLFVFGVVLRTRFGTPPHAPPPVYGTTAPPPMPPPATGTGP